MTFPEAIQCIRLVHGMTQAELSDALDHGQSWCSKVERALTEPALLDIESLSQMFGLELVRGEWTVKAPKKAIAGMRTHA